MPEGQNKYKDRLFSFIFGNEEHRDWTLSLYNAVNGTHYEDASQIVITTIKEALYLGMHNDVSFMISNEMPRDFVTRPLLEAHKAEVKDMLLTEYDEAKAMELFRMEGREEGKEEGKIQFGALIAKLLRLGRTDDALRASTDPVYRERLIEEFQIS